MIRKLIDILRLLSISPNGCTHEHIVLHTNIPEPMPFLDKLCTKGYVCNTTSENGSLIPGHRFKITSKGMKRIEKSNMQTIRIPLALLVTTFQAENSGLSRDQVSQLEVEY